MDLWGVVTGAASATAAWVGLAIRQKDQRAEELAALRSEFIEALERHAASSSKEHSGLASQVTDMIHTQAGLLGSQLVSLATRFDKMTERIDVLYQSADFRKRQGDDD